MVCDHHGRRPGGKVAHDCRLLVLPPNLAVEWTAAGVPSEHTEQIVLNLGEHAQAFELYRVSTAVGNVRSPGPQLISPISDSYSNPSKFRAQ